MKKYLRGNFLACDRQLGIKIWKWSLIPRASIDQAATNDDRDHWHNNATQQIRDFPVAGTPMLHATGVITDSQRSAKPDKLAPLLVPKTKVVQAKPLACLCEFIAAEAS